MKLPLRRRLRRIAGRQGSSEKASSKDDLSSSSSSSSSKTLTSLSSTPENSSSASTTPHDGGLSKREGKIPLEVGIAGIDSMEEKDSGGGGGRGGREELEEIEESEKSEKMRNGVPFLQDSGDNGNGNGDGDDSDDERVVKNERGTTATKFAMELGATLTLIMLTPLPSRVTESLPPENRWIWVIQLTLTFLCVFVNEYAFDNAGVFNPVICMHDLFYHHWLGREKNDKKSAEAYVHLASHFTSLLCSGVFLPLFYTDASLSPFLTAFDDEGLVRSCMLWEILYTLVVILGQLFAKEILQHFCIRVDRFNAAFMSAATILFLCIVDNGRTNVAVNPIMAFAFHQPRQNIGSGFWWVYGNGCIIGSMIGLGIRNYAVCNANVLNK